MEEDRAQVDIGAAVEAELSADQYEQPRQPKKRFIGRKAAAARAGAQADANGSVADSGAIQGSSNKTQQPWYSMRTFTDAR